MIRRMRLFSARVLFDFYRWILSPALHLMAGPGNGCRFEKTCSRFAFESVVEHGWLRGGYLGLRRFLQCNPWVDPKVERLSNG